MVRSGDYQLHYNVFNLPAFMQMGLSAQGLCKSFHAAADVVQMGLSAQGLCKSFHAVANVVQMGC